MGKDGQLDFCTVVMGGARIMFMRAPCDTPSPAGKQPVEIYLEVEDVDALHSRLEKKGVATSDPLALQWWAIGPSRSLIRMATRFGSIRTSRSRRPLKGRSWSERRPVDWSVMP